MDIATEDEERAEYTEVHRAWEVGPGAGDDVLPSPACGGDALEERKEALREWLQSLDDGKGIMLQYFDALVAHFDADFIMIAAALTVPERAGRVESIDHAFWDDIAVVKAGHRMLFARGIAKLLPESQ